MLDQPLRPFAPPAGLEHLAILSAVPPTLILQWGFYLVGGLWALYTLVVVYHWLRYSHSPVLMLPAIATHLYVSYRIVVFAVTGIISL